MEKATYRITAPMTGVNETIGTAIFENSVATTDDEWLIDWFLRRGYEVEKIEESEEIEKVKTPDSDLLDENNEEAIKEVVEEEKSKKKGSAKAK